MSGSDETDDIKPKGAAASPKKTRSKRAQSMFFPVLFVGLGTVLLFVALDLITTVNWEAALQLWPLLLIFIGLDLIVRVVPSPGGTILSLVVGLMAAGIFIYVLLYSSQVPFLAESVGQSGADLKTETLTYPAEGVAAADITLELGSQGASITALEDSPNLIEADVSFTGDLIFEVVTSDDLAAVELKASSTADWVYWMNPLNWFNEAENHRWEIGMSPVIPTNLDLELGSGPAILELDDLTLTTLNVDGSSGQVDMVLPDGDYDGAYDVGSGSVSITLPQKGQGVFRVEGGSGKLDILVPASMGVMVLVEDKGSGRIALDESLFSQIEKGEDGQGVWITDDYNNSANRVELNLDTGSGSVTIEEE
jgi:hypothetical protein